MISYCNDSNRNKDVHVWSKEQNDCIIQSLQEGNIIVGTSDTVFGLLATPSQAGFDALNRIKGRQEKPYLLLVGSIDQALSYVDQKYHKEMAMLMKECWPGPVTLIVPAKETIPDYMKSKAGTIAMRYPQHEGLQMVLKTIPALFSTSANLAGGQIPQTVQEIDPTIYKASTHVIVDAQEKTGPVVPSTLIDCTALPYTIVRAGAFSQKDLDLLMQKMGCMK